MTSTFESTTNYAPSHVPGEVAVDAFLQLFCGDVSGTVTWRQRLAAELLLGDSMDCVSDQRFLEVMTQLQQESAQAEVEASSYDLADCSEDEVCPTCGHSQDDHYYWTTSPRKGCQCCQALEDDEEN